MKQLAVLKQINGMNFDELLQTKAKVEAAIDARIGEERRRLEASLEKLNAISLTVKVSGRVSKRRNGAANGTLAPKYRNPANPKETWAGRGHRPRWLVAAMKGSKKKLSDFSVARAQ